MVPRARREAHHLAPLQPPSVRVDQISVEHDELLHAAMLVRARSRARFEAEQEAPGALRSVVAQRLPAHARNRRPKPVVRPELLVGAIGHDPLPPGLALVMDHARLLRCPRFCVPAGWARAPRTT